MGGETIFLTQLEDLLLLCGLVGYAWQNAIGIIVDLAGFVVLTIAALKAADLTSRAIEQEDAVAVQTRLATAAEYQGAMEADVLSELGG